MHRKSTHGYNPLCDLHPELARPLTTHKKCREAALVSTPDDHPFLSRSATAPFQRSAKSPNLCFVFICQSGDLEIKAMLLAASLRRHLRGSFELVAAIPGPRHIWGAPGEATLDFLTRLRVRLVGVQNRVSLDYPIGNKFSCLQVSMSADRVVFLDSDMLCVTPWDPGARFMSPFLAAPADFATFPPDPKLWARLYNHFGLPMPELRLFTSVTQEPTPPYFNSGLVAVDRAFDFGSTWIDCARRIDAMTDIPTGRSHLSQVALPIAVARLGLPMDVLDQRYNYPAHLQPVRSTRLPFLVHYHTPDTLRTDRVALALTHRIVAGNRALEEAMADDADWRPVLPSPRKRRIYAVTPSWAQGAVHRFKYRHTEQHPELIITGISRSGTSYFCRLLHMMPNAVIINQPRIVTEALQGQSLPWRLAMYFREIRRDVLDGKPIENLLEGGLPIDNTIGNPLVSTYQPVVTREDFIVGVKNVRAFLGRLDDILRVMPDARVVACVRNPFDAIASWKRSFSHLRNPDLRPDAVGNVDDPLIAEPQRRVLRQVDAVKSKAVKRALLWRYLAEQVLEHRRDLTVVRYEEFVQDPAPTIGDVFARFGRRPRAHELRRLPRGSPRSSKDELDPEDIEAIRCICGPSAAALGVMEPA